MQMGIPGQKIAAAVIGGPTPLAGGFHRRKSGAVTVACRIVKFVSCNRFSFSAKKRIFLRRQFDIAEMAQLVCQRTFRRDSANPGSEGRPFSESLLEIHIAAAFGKTRQPLAQGVPNGTTHRRIAAQRRSMQFRIAAAQIQGLAVRQRRIVKGAEKDEFRSQTAQQVEDVVIIKAEGFIPRYGYANRTDGRKGKGLNGNSRRLLRQTAQALQV